jgi:hypothetical protein
MEGSDTVLIEDKSYLAIIPPPDAVLVEGASMSLRKGDGAPRG